jgi:hypothetical protein
LFAPENSNFRVLVSYITRAISIPSFCSPI